MRLAHSKKGGSCGTVIQLGSLHRNLMGRDAATSSWNGATTRPARAVSDAERAQRARCAPFCARKANRSTRKRNERKKKNRHSRTISERFRESFFQENVMYL